MHKSIRANISFRKDLDVAKHYLWLKSAEQWPKKKGGQLYSKLVLLYAALLSPVYMFSVIVLFVCRAVHLRIFIFFEGKGIFFKQFFIEWRKQALLQFLVCAVACANCKCACFSVGYFFFPLFNCLVFFPSSK